MKWILPEHQQDWSDSDIEQRLLTENPGLPGSPCFCIQSGSSMYAMTPLSAKLTGIIENIPEDLRIFLQFYPVSLPRLAKWAANTGLDTVQVMEAFGSKINYRSVEEWKEAAGYSEVTVQAAEKYGLPVSVLRLYERLSSNEQNRLNRLFDTRSIKRNLIREMIQDFYDLNTESRSATLKSMEIFSDSWKAKSGVFPQHELRDMVRQARYPQHFEMQSRLKKILKTLPKENGLRIFLPDHFESGQVQIEISTNSQKDLEKKLRILASEDVKQSIEKMLDMV